MSFEAITEALTEIYNNLKPNEEGKVADYIPQLAKVNPDLFGISVCTIDGQRWSIGDTQIDFCLQSCSKPLVYCMARELLSSNKENTEKNSNENGDEISRKEDRSQCTTSRCRVHQYVGYEPSGRGFNAYVLDENGHPHNPMINAGAMMVASLILPKEEPAERFELIRHYLNRMAGKVGGRIGFNNGVFLSEQRHADRNFSLAYFMNEQKAFPPGTNLTETLNLYFQACSITVNCQIGGIMAGTLAAGGICPVTKERVFQTETVRDCLSLMYLCGMYDFSGRFAFEMGLPAKSGVSGSLMVVVPNKMGICIWSPRLDTVGNSVRGVEVCRRLVRRFKLHLFHNLFVTSDGNNGNGNGNGNDDNSNDGSNSCNEDITIWIQRFITAASQGDNAIVEKLLVEKRLGEAGANAADYDKRTALHLAAAEGHLDTVKLLLNAGADPEVLDRWGNSPRHEACKGGHDTIYQLFDEN